MSVDQLELSKPSAQDIFDQIEQELGAGMVPRIFKLLEGYPDLLTHLWGQFRIVILQGSLPRTLKEMAGLVVAVSTHCDYVRVVHMHSLTLQGIAKEALEALTRSEYTSLQFNSLSQNVLRFAALTVATRSAYGAPNGDWAGLRQQTKLTLSATGLSAPEKIELMATVALFEQICTVANLLELDPSQP